MKLTSRSCACSSVAERFRVCGGVRWGTSRQTTCWPYTALTGECGCALLMLLARRVCASLQTMLAEKQALVMSSLEALGPGEWCTAQTRSCPTPNATYKCRCAAGVPLPRPR